MIFHVVPLKPINLTHMTVNHTTLAMAVYRLSTPNLYSVKFPISAVPGISLNVQSLT
jgi:hypothetical protein